MAGRINSAFKSDLLARIDIVELINRQVPLKRAGALYSACCPFHDEKSPSFTVTPSRQTYHCFGCGAHGNAIDFLIEYNHLNFPEAVEELARQVGLEIPEDDGTPIPRAPDNRPLYALMEQAAQIYQGELRQHPQARRAVDYLKRRGLSGQIAAAFDSAMHRRVGISFLAASAAPNKTAHS
jgi:DNA primase